MLRQRVLRSTKLVYFGHKQFYHSLRKPKLLFNQTNRQPTIIKYSQSVYENKCDKSHDTQLIRDVSLDTEKGIVHFEWSTNTKSSLSSIFLRDSCRCSTCFNEQSKQRMIDTCRDIPLDIFPSDVRIAKDNVTIFWPDKHKTVFTHKFLWQQNQKLKDISHIKPIIWKNSDIKDKVPAFDLNSVLSLDSKRFSWFENLCKYGVTLLTGAEPKLGQLEKVKLLFGGYYKSTHYGDTFQVISKPNPSSLAYTTDAILPHVDLPHYWYPPGIQVLHCIEQFAGEGADNTFVDGFNVAQQLQEDDPESFKVLTNYNVVYRDVGTDYYGEFETFYERPIIGFKNGKIKTVDYSNWLRDYYMKGSAEEIQRFYRAYYKFTQRLNEPENVFTYKLKEGEIVVFHNRRIMHGRNGYQGGNTQRILEGCYFDWDSLYWSMRPVKRRLDQINVEA